jgi:hypothetical protein
MTDNIESTVKSLLSSHQPHIALTLIKQLFSSSGRKTQLRVMRVLDDHFNITPVKVVDNG